MIQGIPIMGHLKIMTLLRRWCNDDCYKVFDFLMQDGIYRDFFLISHVSYLIYDFTTPARTE